MNKKVVKKTKEKKPVAKVKAVVKKAVNKVKADFSSKSLRKAIKTLEDGKAKGATFNEYGTCIECQGGNPDCLHNNLVETNGGTFCTVCGLKVV